jgi:hypothetical protein
MATDEFYPWKVKNIRYLIPEDGRKFVISLILNNQYIQSWKG